MANTLTGRLCSFHFAAYILVLIGAINWGLIGVGWFFGLNLNIVNILFGGWPLIENIVYVIVGLMAAFMIAQPSCDSCREKNF